MYPLGAISSLTDTNLTVNGTINVTYFSVLTTGDEVTLNEETVEVDSVINDFKFKVKTAFTSGNTGDIIYVSDRCIWLKYQIRRLDFAISNYDMELLGVARIENGEDQLDFHSNKTPLTELISLRNMYRQELQECENKKNNSNSFLVRRFEYGTM